VRQAFSCGGMEGAIPHQMKLLACCSPHSFKHIIGLERKTEIEIFPLKVKVGEDFLFQDSTLNLRGLSGGDRSF